jgi:hypothetical protein
MERAIELPEATLEEFETAKALGDEEFCQFVETHSLGEIWDQLVAADIAAVEDADDINGRTLAAAIASGSHS